mmetsp:Transcript_54874/g.139073  ORF Transcript_54874/g.139073 Transcript_54874/m.139073 type:complete len:280 (+) Transcript_54874:427-1266(+)
MLRQIGVSHVCERRGYGEVRLVAAWNDTKSTVSRTSILELHADREELGPHLAVAEGVCERPSRLAALRDSPAMQCVALRTELLSDHQGRVVEPVANAHELRKRRDKAPVTKHLSEGLAVWLRPTEHAAHILAARRAIAGQGRTLPAVERGGPELALAFVQRLQMRIDRGIRGLDLRLAEDVAQDDVAVQVEEIFLRVGHSRRSLGPVMLVTHHIGRQVPRVPDARGPRRCRGCPCTPDGPQRLLRAAQQPAKRWSGASHRAGAQHGTGLWGHRRARPGT